MSGRKGTLRKQFEAFSDGRYLDSDGTESHCYNFYDWFCKDTSLKGKANTLFRASRRFVKKLAFDLKIKILLIGFHRTQLFHH